MKRGEGEEEEEEGKGRLSIYLRGLVLKYQRRDR